MLEFTKLNAETWFWGGDLKSACFSPTLRLGGVDLVGQGQVAGVGEVQRKKGC